MPELPDLTVYCEQLTRRIGESRLTKIVIAHPFLLRSVEPGIDDLEGKSVRDITLIGKRIAIGFEDELFAVIHLMVAGRFQWREEPAPIPKKLRLASAMMAAEIIREA